MTYKDRGGKIRGTAPSGFYRTGFLLACCGLGPGRRCTCVEYRACTSHLFEYSFNDEVKKNSKNNIAHNERDRYSATTLPSLGVDERYRTFSHRGLYQTFNRHPAALYPNTAVLF